MTLFQHVFNIRVYIREDHATVKAIQKHVLTCWQDNYISSPLRRTYMLWYNMSFAQYCQYNIFTVSFVKGKWRSNRPTLLQTTSSWTVMYWFTCSHIKIIKSYQIQHFPNLGLYEIQVELVILGKTFIEYIWCKIRLSIFVKC